MDGVDNTKNIKKSNNKILNKFYNNFICYFVYSRPTLFLYIGIVHLKE